MANSTSAELKTAANQQTKGKKNGPTTTQLKQGTPKTAGEGKGKKLKIRPPRVAAVVLTPPTEGGLSRADIMSEARSKIKLEDLPCSLKDRSHRGCDIGDPRGAQCGES